MMSMSYNDQHGMLTIREKLWHVYLGVPIALKLDSRPSQQEGNQAWYWKCSQLLSAGEVMDLRGEPTTTTLLNQHKPQLILSICPSSHRLVCSSSLNKKSFLCNKQITAENHNQSKSRFMEPSPSGFIYKTSLEPKAQGTLWKAGIWGAGVVKARGLGSFL